MKRRWKSPNRMI